MTKDNLVSKDRSTAIEAKNGQEQHFYQPPEDVLSKFIDAWTRCDWEEMANNCQLSWVTAIDDPTEALRGLFQYKPLKIEVESVKEYDGLVYVARMKITASIARGVTQERVVEARLLCESAPLQPSRDGLWGVNPLSLYNKVKE